MNAFTLPFALLIGHAVCDYPLQGDFLAQAKNRHITVQGIDWRWCMAMHSLIHAGAVWLITGLWYLGLAELVCHFLIDCLKCDGVTDFSTDQTLHIACKLLWGILWLMR